MLRAFAALLILMQIACSNGGSLTLETNTSFSTGDSQFKGSCLSTGTPLVLTEGYCTEFFRVVGSARDPGTECTQGFGFLDAGECAQIEQTNGRCFVRDGGDINLVYFAASPNGPALCSSAGGQWQAGSKF